VYNVLFTRSVKMALHYIGIASPDWRCIISVLRPLTGYCVP
jgi:hypothetical protein